MGSSCPRLDLWPLWDNSFATLEDLCFISYVSLQLIARRAITGAILMKEQYKMCDLLHAQ